MSSRDFLNLILPPSSSDEPALTRWRYMVAILILTGYAMIGCLYLITARASEVESIKDEVKSMRIESLESQLFEARLSQCRTDNVQLKQVYGERLSKLQRKYSDITERSYELPECGDLI